MTTTPVDAVPASTAAERDAIQSAIAGGTLLTAFAETSENFANVEAYRWLEAGEWRSLTYRRAREQVRDLTLGLRSIGLRPGEFAVIWSRNRPEANLADLAVMHARGVPVFLYNTLAAEQAGYIAGHCEATVAIVEDRSFLTRLAAERPRLPHLRRVVLMEGEIAADEHWLISWNSLLALGRDALERSPWLFEATWRQVGPESLATLIYTSGTTGPPKGVMLTHHNVRYCAAALLTALPPSELADEAGIRMISYLPMAHAAGRFTDHWLPMLNPATVVFCPDASRLFPLAAEIRPTLLLSVPRVWEKLQAALQTRIAAEQDPERRQTTERAIEAGRRLVRHRQRREQAPFELQAMKGLIASVGRAVLASVGLDACRLAITAAAPIDPDVIEFFQAIGLPLTEAWGMTELTGAATISHPDRTRNGAVGIACPGVELQVADDGEVLVRGPLVMRGYYRDLARTADALDADGWLHTGDVGALDDEGQLHIVDRKKELIITSGGKNISPATIEGLLQRHPLIGQACTIGDRRNYVTALLVLDGETARGWAHERGIRFGSLAELTGHPQILAEAKRAVSAANEHLARVEQVRRFMLLPTEWTAETGELTPTLKRRRRFIAERYATEVERLYGPVDACIIEV